jgi:hypothetical protein
MSEINAKNIQDAGFEFEQLDPNVFLIKNFITEEECEFLYNFAETRTQEDWLGTYVKGIEDRSESRYGTRDLNETKLEVTHNWNDKVVYVAGIIGEYRLDQRLKALFDKDCEYSFRSFGVIQRQYTGSELKGHYDQYVDDKMKWAAVIYINDNYTDGELYFSEKQIAIRPPRRSMVVFPSTEEYWHGVKEVGPGPTRYALPAFVWSEPDVF